MTQSKYRHLQREPWCFKCFQQGVWRKAVAVILIPGPKQKKDWYDIFRYKSVCASHVKLKDENGKTYPQL